MAFGTILPKFILMRISMAGYTIVFRHILAILKYRSDVIGVVVAREAIDGFMPTVQIEIGYIMVKISIYPNPFIFLLFLV